VIKASWNGCSCKRVVLASTGDCFLAPAAAAQPQQGLPNIRFIFCCWADSSIGLFVCGPFVLFLSVQVVVFFLLFQQFSGFSSMAGG
jgi:hypothetical protein